MKQRIMVESFYHSNSSDKPIPKNSAVNVIYFTNKCNLACTYCYEDLANRPPQVLTQEDIRKYVDDVIEREGDTGDNLNQTLFVLFGGEATLEWDNVCYLMQYAYSKKKNVSFNLESNGIKFLSDKFILEVKNNFFYKTGLLSIDISFDGIGNGDRIFHNGMDSTNSMITIFKKMNNHGMKYRIRYTIQRNNIDYLYEDVNRIMNTFKPQRLITSVAWTTLLDEDYEKLNNAKELFRKDWINKTINIPICEMFCDMCNGCSVKKEHKSYFSDEGNIAIYDNSKLVPKFNHFKNKEINNA